jgi:hypothetical protein
VNKALILAFCSFIPGLGCKTPQTQELPVQELSVRDRLEKIRAAYAPAPCFYASFGVESFQPGKSGQKADGTVRVDNANRRVRFYFTDSIFGITLSHMTIRDGFVYIGSPRDPVQQIPVDRFVVGGLANNSIRLPFRLFEDLMYGRVPEQVFADKTHYRTEGARLFAEYEDRESKSVYEFENDRMRSVTYLHKQDRANAKAEMTGTYPRSPFPQKMELNGWIDGPPEKMIVNFQGVDMTAVCKEVQFPVN